MSVIFENSMLQDTIRKEKCWSPRNCEKSRSRLFSIVDKPFQVISIQIFECVLFIWMSKNDCFYQCSLSSLDGFNFNSWNNGITNDNCCWYDKVQYFNQILCFMSCTSPSTSIRLRLHSYFHRINFNSNR